MQVELQDKNQLRAYIEEKVAFVSTEINSHFDGITWQLFTKKIVIWRKTCMSKIALRYIMVLLLWGTPLVKKYLCATKLMKVCKNYLA